MNKTIIYKIFNSNNEFIIRNRNTDQFGASFLEAFNKLSQHIVLSPNNIEEFKWVLNDVIIQDPSYNVMILGICNIPNNHKSKNNPEAICNQKEINKIKDNYTYTEKAKGYMENPLLDININISTDNNKVKTYANSYSIAEILANNIELLKNDIAAYEEKKSELNDEIIKNQLSIKQLNDEKYEKREYVKELLDEIADYTISRDELIEEIDNIYDENKEIIDKYNNANKEIIDKYNDTKNEYKAKTDEITNKYNELTKELKSTYLKNKETVNLKISEKENEIAELEKKYNKIINETSYAKQLLKEITENISSTVKKIYTPEEADKKFLITLRTRYMNGWEVIPEYELNYARKNGVNVDKILNELNNKNSEAYKYIYR